MFEFNCAMCGHYKVIVNKILYRYHIDDLYCCNADCFEKLKEKFKGLENEN